MALTLADVRLVVSGTFGEVDAEDVRTSLVTRGAYVMDSVTSRTALLIAGEGPATKHLRAAQKHGTPVVGLAGLKALLAGASVQEAVAGAGPLASARDLEGWKVALVGSIQNAPAVIAALEGRGARVVKRPTASCDLLIAGTRPNAAGVLAMDSGVPFLCAADIPPFIAGAPMTDFVGASSGPFADPQTEAARVLDAVLPALVGIPAGEAWDDVLTLTLAPSGRIVAELRDLGGTPLHDHVRRTLQRQRWPATAAAIRLTRPLAFS